MGVERAESPRPFGERIGKLASVSWLADLGEGLARGPLSNFV
jgi:hypothetical protein